VLILALPSGIVMGPRVVGSKTEGVNTHVLLDNASLRSPKFYSAIMDTAKALQRGTHAQDVLFSTDPDDDGPNKKYNTGFRIRTREDQKGINVSVAKLWRPSTDANYQMRLANKVVQYNSMYQQDVWRGSSDWCWIGTDLVAFARVIRALASLLPACMGSGENIAELGNQLYQKLSTEVDITTSTEAEKVQVFSAYMDHISKDKAALIVVRADKTPNLPFLDKFILRAVGEGSLTAKAAKSAKTCLAKSAPVLLNAFRLETVFANDQDMTVTLLKLIAEDQAREVDAALGMGKHWTNEQNDDDQELLAGAEEAELMRTRDEGHMIDTQALLDRSEGELQIASSSSSNEELEESKSEDEEEAEPSKKKKKKKKKRKLTTKTTAKKYKPLVEDISDGEEEEEKGGKQQPRTSTPTKTGGGKRK
jgi:hypothetical protein